ncbi:FecR family protein [Rhodothermus marinus]|uniref:FecR family protein n=1 Tax=Rhodothermus marinus TaxID=29549 RepID=UPI0012BA3A3B|nr:FecR domain-containing protein [Rhodothermus marinus]BBM70410.1 hypothetical protein RmaAA213_22560 [Rhodothermus marinus]BBM73397.1 hypothetical protein RmaAA338_22620 [Rhodothermus marinus]
MQQPDWTLLARYLEGTTTPEERARVEAWCAADPAHRALLKRLEVIWRTPPARPGAWDAEAAWLQVARQVRAAGTGRPPRRSRRRKLPYGVRVALVLVLLLIPLGVLLWRMTSPAPSRVAEVVTWDSWRTTTGEQKILRLADGTRIWMAPESQVDVQQPYMQHRTLRVRGEVYVEVAEASGVCLLAGPVTIRDIGTRFLVRADHPEALVQVVVEEGLVAMQAAARADSLVVAAGMLGRYDAQQSRLRVLRLSDQDLRAYFSWMQGTLVFQTASLEEVQRQLLRWFGVHFVFPPTHRQAHLTASFQLRQPIAEIAEAIGLALHLRPLARGDSIIFQPTQPE